LIQALEGHITDHHRFMIKTIMSNIKKLEQTLEELDQQIDAQTKPYEQEKELLQTIPGVGGQVAVVMLSEIGVEMEQFPSHKQLASWAGISPGNNQSAGKTQSSRINKGNKWLKSKLVEAGWGAARSKGTYMYSKYRSLVSRKGAKKAVIAIGHKILIAAYYILRDKLSYKDLGYQYIEKLKQGRLSSFSRDQASQIETGIARLGVS
jgi:transposase